jgi:hypothetical protein
MMVILLQDKPPAAVERTCLELREDWLTGWAADSAGLYDVDGYVRGGVSHTDRPLQWLTVPRPGGSPMRVPVLHPYFHVRLHRLGAKVRETIDNALLSGVIGYRRGCDPESPYAKRWQDFSAATRDHARLAGHVVFADVSHFFHSANWECAVKALDGLGQHAEADELADIARSLSVAGLSWLPPGYGDARMLANLVLDPIDRSLNVPFVRWVDDYRLFVPYGDATDGIVDSLASELRAHGFALNRLKLRCLSAGDAMREIGNALASAYHPERDPHEVVLAGLRQLFERAIANPVEERTTLRFVLARLQREKDDYAVDFALTALTGLPWEAPRLVAYLSAFSDAPRVRKGVESALCAAVKARNPWLAARLAPLAAQIGISRTTALMISSEHAAFRGSPAWGLLLRVASSNGYADALGAAKRDPADARAVLACMRDLDEAIPDDLAEKEPILAVKLAGAPAPLPTSESLL